MRSPFKVLHLNAYIAPLSALAARRVDLPKGIGISFASSEADLIGIDEAAARDGYRRRFDTMKSTMDEGGRIAIADYDGSPVAWMMFNKGYQDSYRWIRLIGAGESAFSFGLYTVRDWRRRQLAAALTNFCAGIFLTYGCQHHCCIVEQGNTASRRLREVLGYRRVGFVHATRFGRKAAFIRTDQQIRAGLYTESNPYIYRFPLVTA